ncbi:MAG TPA: PEP-CTERM sorting domain-containing protein [Pyrinomonadaceae bacterium]|nr:PEP-CTERM sorting domain-containing protein [Pyrinomonadaceae bacterium]
MSQLLNFRRVAVSLAMFAVVVFGSTTAKADPITFVLSGDDFSGPTANTGGNITVHIQNIAGGVRITITNNLVDPGAFLSQLYMNTAVAPLAGAAGSCVDCTATNGQTMSFNFGSNAFQADGDGLYDIFIDFSSALADRLTPGEVIVFDLTSTTLGFTSDSFLVFSAPAGGNGPFLIAAHIQGLPNGQSDWITHQEPIPEPATLLLLGTGLMGVAGTIRRRMKK